MDYLINLKNVFNIDLKNSIVIDAEKIDAGTLLFLKKNNIRLKSVTFYLFFMFRNELQLRHKNNIVFIENANDLINKNYHQFHMWVKTIIKKGVVTNKIYEKRQGSSLYDNSLQAYESISTKGYNLGRMTSEAAVKDFEALNEDCKRIIKFINSKVKEGVLIDSIYLYTYYLNTIKGVPKFETEKINVKDPEKGLRYVEFIKYIFMSGYGDDFIDHLKKKLNSIFRIHNPYYENVDFNKLEVVEDKPGIGFNSFKITLSKDDLSF